MVVAEWKKKHVHEECACMWQHRHAQHGNELSRIRLGSIEQGLPCVIILFLDSALFLISSFHATSPFPGSLSYAYHHYLLILGPLTFTVCAL